MAALGTVKFDLLITATQVVRISGATRYDVTSNGTIAILDTEGNTVETIADTTKNVFLSGPFVISATTAASGKVVGVEEGGR